MPSLDDITEVLTLVIREIFKRLADVEEMMCYINSIDDVMNSKYIVLTIGEMNKTLADITTGGLFYMEPMNLLYPDENSNKEVHALFRFYREMHQSFWLIKTKLRYIRDSLLPSFDAVETSVPLMRTLKKLKDLLQPTSEKVRAQLAIFNTPPDDILMEDILNDSNNSNDEISTQITEEADIDNTANSINMDQMITLETNEILQEIAEIEEEQEKLREEGNNGGDLQRQPEVQIVNSVDLEPNTVVLSEAKSSEN